MKIKKFLIISLCIILKTTSFVYACDGKYADDRKMQRQLRKISSKHQRFLDRQVNLEPFQFRPVFKNNTFAGQMILSLCILANVAATVQGLDVKSPTPPSGECHQGSESLSLFGSGDCVITATNQVCQPTLVDTTASIVTGTSNILGNVAVGGANQLLVSATASALEKVFCSNSKDSGHSKCVQISDDKVTFSGTKEEIDDILKRLGDFGKLREKVIPVSPAAAKTEAHPDLQFSNWGEVEKSLGVNHEDLKNMAISECANCNDCADKLGISYDKIKRMEFCNLAGTNSFFVINYKPSEVGVKSFNQKTADSYLETLKEESLFFGFLADKNKNLITYTDGYIFINYGIFNEYLSRLPLQISNQNGIFSTTIPLSNILKRLMAAVSGGVSLEQTPVPGEYHVRMTTLGDTRSLDEKQFTPPVIEAVIDRSGSMSGQPIDTINRKFPDLLQKFKDALKKGEYLKVNIHLLDDTFSLSQSLFLDSNFDQSKWKTIQIGGGTDLTPIGKLLKVENGESSNKVVVAFTDGEHVNGLPLDDAYYRSLESLRASGSFARPFLCKVGSGSDGFFKNIARIFAGSYSETDTIEDCIQRVALSIPSLLESKEPLVLTIDGNNMVIWQQNAQAGIQTTTQTVRNDDVITQGKFKATVHVETKEEKKARLKAELAALEADEKV